MRSIHILISIVVAILSNLQAQTPLGAAIVGEAAGDRSGVAVALSSDGMRMAIGAYLNDENGQPGTNPGHVRVYEWTSGVWVQMGSDIDGENWHDGFGYSVAMSSDGVRVAIGAPNHDSGAGHVRVYDWSGIAWVQVGSDIDGDDVGDQSGHNIAISASGNRIAVGAYRNDQGGADAGHVRIYDWVGAAWSLVGEIEGEAPGDWAGYSVALSSDGSRLAMGATHNDGGGAGVFAGHVRVYQESGGSWVLLGAEIEGESAGDICGYDVSLSDDGSRLAVGAAYNSGVNGPRSGHVRIYDWTGSGWNLVGGDIDGEAAGDESGWSVALSANGCRVAIGGVRNDGGGVGIDAGHVRVFDWNGVAWTRAADIGGQSAGDYFGASVSMSADGSRVVAGALLGNSGAGYVRAWLLSGIGSGAGSIAVSTISQCPSPMTIAVSGSPHIGGAVAIGLSGATGIPMAGFGFPPLVPVPSPCVCNLIGDGQGGVGAFMAVSSWSLAIPCDTVFIGVQLLCQGIDLFPSPVGCTALGVHFGLTDIWAVTIG